MIFKDYYVFVWVFLRDRRFRDYEDKRLKENIVFDCYLCLFFGKEEN